MALPGMREPWEYENILPQLETYEDTLKLVRCQVGGRINLITKGMEIASPDGKTLTLYSRNGGSIDIHQIGDGTLAISASIVALSQF